jgi:MFS family permease
MIAGFAGGLMGTSCMVYMSEIALPQFRGALLAAFSMAFALGQLFLAVGLKALEDTEPWEFRRMFYSEFVFTGLWLVPLLLLPESPGKHPKVRIVAAVTNRRRSMVLLEGETRRSEKGFAPAGR